MPRFKKPSLLLGFLLNFLWPGLGQMYFRHIKRGIFLAVLGLFLPGIMFIASCIDLFFLNRKAVPAADISWPEWDVPWTKVLKISFIVGFVLLVVYSLYIGIFFMYITRRGRSNAQQTWKEMRSIKHSIAEYYEKHDAYPDSLQAIIKRRPLRKTWLRDSWKNEYRYAKQTNGFELRSAGKDKQFNTEDDIITSNSKKKE